MPTESKLVEGRIEESVQNSRSQEELIQQLISEYSRKRRKMEPVKGIDRFLKFKSPEITSITLNEYEDKLVRFENFCERQSISDLSELDGHILDEYALWLRHEASDQVDELSSKTMRDEMYLLRNFITYLEKIEVVKRGLSDAIDIPKLSGSDGVRNVDMDPERVRAVLEYLDRFEYASLEHVVWLLTAHVGRRTGGIISLDLGDAHLDAKDPYLEFNHRPPTTRLKNKEKGEGPVAISDADAEVIREYIEKVRPDIIDEEGREPLLATGQGRISRSTFRRYMYKWSRPCAIGEGCPHNRNPDDCEAAQSMDVASKCPSSRSPHALRHGYITDCRRNGVPIEVLSDRCDVSEEVIREVYDETTEEERLTVRRQILDDYSSDNGGGYL